MRNEENYKDFILEVLGFENTEENKKDIVLLKEDDFIAIEMELSGLGYTEKSKRDLGEILKMRFGLGDNGIKMTLKAIGRKIRITQEAVRGFQNQALLKLIRYRKRVFKKFLVSEMRERINELEKFCEEYGAKINVLEYELERKNLIIEEKDKIINSFTNLTKINEEKIELLPKLNISINDLDISVRMYNYLVMANLRTLGDIVKKTEREMLMIKNFGRKSLNELKNILAEYGLEFGMNLPDILQE